MKHKDVRPSSRDAQWEKAAEEWRNPLEVAALWEGAAKLIPGALTFRTKGEFWEILEESGIALVVTREYEHLLLGLSCVAGKPTTTFFRLPHPSGVAFDQRSKRLFVASTRNPNQIFEFAPVSEFLARRDIKPPSGEARLFYPRQARFLPGSCYLHDLAFVGEKLCATAVGHNAIIAFPQDQDFRYEWWPKSVERKRGELDSSLNYLQLNSIAAGSDLRSSFFTASTAEPSTRRPGQRNFPVDGRGVLFSGKSREVVCAGLTRPHSARFFRKKVWLNNSGYGQLGVVDGNKFVSCVSLPGWTRGLAFHGKYAFVATSRVLPRFRQYAPGVDLERSVCGVHVVEMKSGEIVGSLLWPTGNQIFAVEAVPTPVATGFPFLAGRPSPKRALAQFYTYRTG